MAISDRLADPYSALVNELVALVSGAPNHIEEIRHEYLGKFHETCEKEERRHVSNLLGTAMDLLYNGDYESRKTDKSRLALINYDLSLEFPQAERAKVVCLLVQAHKELYNDQIPYIVL